MRYAPDACSVHRGTGATKLARSFVCLLALTEGISMSPPTRGYAGKRGNEENDNEERPIDFPRETERFFETSLDLLAISDTEGQFLEVNPRFEEVLGWTSQELTSRPYIEFVHPDDRKATRACLQKNLTGDRTVRGFINRYQCKDGSYRWLEWQSRMYEEDGVIYASARDITDRRRARREKRQLQEHALRAHQLESVSALAAGIAHKFNNRLTTILGNADLLAKELEGSELSGRAAAIEQAAHQADELCNQLLVYAGDEKVERRPSDLTDVIASTDQLLRSVLSEGVELKFELQESMPSVPLDPARIRQVVFNLVTNADDAIEGDGAILVRTAAREIDRTELTTGVYGNELDQREYAVLTVEDSGSGMDSEIQKRMFEPFFTTKFMGRGVGLAATLGIVRAHNGAILVDSEPSVGSEISVLLPTSPETVPVDEGLKPPELGDGTVVVADDFSAVSLIRRTLTDPDVQVRAADTDTELFSLLRSTEELIAVIIDPVHPRFREMQVVERSSESIDDSTPIIASTVSPSDRGPSRGDIELADAILEKPYTAGQLLDLLADVCR